MGYYKIDEDIENLVYDVVDKTGLNQYIDFKVLATNKSKILVKVMKTSAITDAIAKTNDCVTVIIYEKAFARLDEPTQRILLEDALNVVAYDTEKCRIVIGSPQIIITVGGRKKYGDELINAAEVGVLAMQQIADEEEEEKQRRKEEKAAKRAAKGK